MWQPTVGNVVREGRLARLVLTLATLHVSAWRGIWRALHVSAWE